MRATTVLVGTVLLSIGFVYAVACQTGAASSTASATAANGTVRATSGGYVFEQGESVAVEIVRGDPCPCLCDPLLVTGFSIRDQEGAAVRFATESPSPTVPVPFDQWLGVWDVLRPDGAPIVEGTYTLTVDTNLGTFVATAEIVAPGMAWRRGLAASQASVCSMELRVYRMIDERHAATDIRLRRGDRLLARLPGNVTTGFVWQCDRIPEILTAIPGREYVTAAVHVGAPGWFLLRYDATASGEGGLSFSYRRPWESVAPAETYDVTITTQ